jgi:hypothetical protein
VGGVAATVHLEASLVLGDGSYEVVFRVFLPPPEGAASSLGAIPSLLGRDFLAHFGLILEQRTGREFLLEPAEVDRLPLPA